MEEPSPPSLTDAIERLGGRIREYHGSLPLSDADVSVMLAELESAHEKLRVADDELRAQRGELEDLLNRQRDSRSAQDWFLAALPAAVVVSDSAGVIQTANAAAAALLGDRVDRLLRQPLLALIDPGDRAEVRRALAQLTTGRAPGFRLVVTLAPRTGDPTQVDLTATAAARPGDPDDRPDVTWALLTRPSSSGAATPGLADVLVELTQLPLTTTNSGEILRRVAVLSQQAFANPVSISITRGAPCNPDQVASDSQFAQQLDALQVTAEKGPCQSAYEDRVTVAVPDLHADPRWPDYRAGAAGLGLRSVVAVPVAVGDEVLGALNIYSKDPGFGGADTVRSAELLATAVAAVVHEAELKLELETLSEHLRTALKSRSTIDQAKGVIMAREHCTADEAFQVLVRISSRTNVKLREVARRVVFDAGTSRG